MTPQSHINRANAQHSTGPKTAEGKQRSSLNALRHGLTGQVVVMPFEDLEAYQRHLTSFEKELKPQGPVESHLAQSLAETVWRLNRVAVLETNLLTLGLACQPLPHMNADSPLHDALAMAAGLETQTKALANLGLHTQRLSRFYDKTLTQLQKLQETRRDQEQSALSELLDILEMYKDKGEPYTPSEDGFVFSEPQIAAAKQARHRARLAEEAYEYEGAAAA
jgi:hypothetical protein